MSTLSAQLLSCLMITVSTTAQAIDPVVALWPGKPPVVAKEPGQEAEEDGRVRNVRIPALIPYLLPQDDAQSRHTATQKHPPIPEKRPAMLIFPGGGYGHLAVKKEGEAAARWANGLGAHAFIVKYRLNQFGAPAPVMDAQQAVRLVRAYADRWNVDSTKVGVVGFSAGGHVAASVSQHYDHNFFTHIDPPATPPATAKFSARPDFSILVYPVITLNDPFTHAGSRRALVGGRPSKTAIEFYSLETQVSSSSPPTFIVHSSADSIVPIENSVLYWQALRAAGVATEFLAFQFGGHGFGLEDENQHTANWPARAADWLRANGFLQQASPTASIGR